MFYAWFLFGNYPLRVPGFFHMYMWCAEFSERISLFYLSLFSHLVHSFLLCTLGKNLWSLFIYFRDQRWAAGEKKWYKGEVEGKIAVVSGQTAIKRMKAREILVYTYKIKNIHIYIYIYYKDKILKHKRVKIALVFGLTDWR